MIDLLSNSSTMNVGENVTREISNSSLPNAAIIYDSKITKDLSVAALIIINI